MDYTLDQKRALEYLKLTKVTYHKNMYKMEHSLGYNTPGTPYDMIHIADDCPTDEVKKIVLVHEVGHTYFNHIRIDVKKEILDVQELFKKHGVKYRYIKKFGGPMSFLNICMDFEVNSKLLSFDNLNTMKEEIGNLCVPKNFGVEYQETFRDYYEPLILKLKEKQEEAQRKAKELLEQMKNNQDNEDSDSDEEEGEGDSSSNYSDSDDNNSNGSSVGNPFEDGDDSEDYEDSDEDFDDYDSEDYEDSEDNEDSEDYDFDDEDFDIGDVIDPDVLEEMLDNMDHDITENVSKFDEDFDEEVQEALKEENYETNEEVNSDSDNDALTTESTVGKETIDEGRLDGYSNEGHQDYNSANLYDIQENNSENIEKFLKNIVKTSYNTGRYYNDYMKSARRGETSDIITSSMKRHFGKKNVKLGVLVDVSGSMFTSSIITACRTLKDCSKALNKDSVVATWDVSLIEEFTITKIPDTIKTGCSTAMEKGIEYLDSVKKCDEIVVYSDFCQDIQPIIDVVKKGHVKVHSIFVGFNNENTLDCNPLLKDYIKMNKSYMMVKSF